jgi:carbon monoxide dehydrogenase subunit G
LGAGSAAAGVGDVTTAVAVTAAGTTFSVMTSFTASGVGFFLKKLNMKVDTVLIDAA